jgi:hypothetical protein
VRTEDRGKYVFSSGVNALQCHIMGIVFQRGVGRGNHGRYSDKRANGILPTHFVNNS